METFEAVTTLAAIRAQHPCQEGWCKLLTHLGKTSADDEPLSLLTVLESNGMDDALWVLDNTGCNPRLARHFGAWCAEQVLHLYESRYPDDKRPRLAIAAARDDDMSKADCYATWAAVAIAAYDATWAEATIAAESASFAVAGFAAMAAAYARQAEYAADNAQSAQFHKMLGGK